MQNFPHLLPQIRRVLAQVSLVLCLGIPQGVSAQAFENGNFENGSVGWSGCLVEIGTASEYGGASSTMVASVNGSIEPDPSDDHLLCQSISGFVVGNAYRLEFDATRSGIGNPTHPVSVIMTLDYDALFRTVVRDGDYSMMNEAFEFTASQTTHQFTVEPDVQAPQGMIFDNFTINSISTLPIELLYFTGESLSAGVRLDWATATEQDNDHFTVQRSRDGQQWNDLLVVQGAGNSSVHIGYSAKDESPISGLAYYRLKQKDIHGDETIFNAVPVHARIETPVELSVFPNPSTNGQLWLAAGRLTEEVVIPVTIMDMQGRLVHTALINMAPGVAVDISNDIPLNEGVYLVSVPFAGVLHGIRVVVQ